jgi:probable phosphomutase (TIGR03848 family)
VTTLLLIRHAESTGNAKHRLMGWTPGVHLTDRGEEQAERLVERLAPVTLTAIYSSPLERCVETARPVATTRGLEVRLARELGEVDYGAWTGRSLAQLSRTSLWRAVQVAPSSVRFPGGEGLSEAQLRAVDIVREIAAAHRRGAVAIVSHADVIRLVLAHLAGVHLDLFQRFVVAPVSVTAVALGDGIPRVLKVNDTGGLADLAPRRARRRKVGT